MWTSHSNIICAVIPTPQLQILDKLLDRESQTHKPQTLSSFYSSKPAAGSQRSPSKHTAANHSGVGGATGGVSKHTQSSSSANTLAASSSSSSSAVAFPGVEATPPADLNPVQNSAAGESTAETREHGKKETLYVVYVCEASPPYYTVQIQSGFMYQGIIKAICSSSGSNMRQIQPKMNNNTTYYTVSLFIEQKPRQNTEAVCEKLSEPLLIPQELRG